VYLSVGGAGRLRRRYRGRDAMDWLYDIGFFDKTVDKLESPEERFSGNPHVSGRDGGREIDLHRFARDGIVLLGRFDGADADTLRFAGDLHERLREIDEFDDKVRGAIDELIAEQGIQAPADDEPRLRDGYAAPILRALDARAADVNSVVWATGYRFDFSLVDAPIFDAHGYPLQQRGVTSVEGLYFVGLPWLWKQKSGLFLGVGEDAAHIADHIAARAST
jgi:putative flavoprotein involved in K+ transport